jgi:tetratricopeptide (TPR) repeat protein
MTEFLEKLNKAYHLYVTEQYSVALPRFNALITTSPTYEAYIGKAATLIKLNRIDEAMQDSGHAISKDESRYEGYYYKGICLFHQSKFSQALTEFENAKSKLGESDIHEYANEQIFIWTNKANAEIAQRKTLVDPKLQPRAQVIEEPKKRSCCSH